MVKEIEQDATRYIDEQTLGHMGKVFDFDKVLHQQSTQEEVYANVAPFLQSVVDGLSVCIMAYGQTGSVSGRSGISARAVRTRVSRC